MAQVTIAVPDCDRAAVVATGGVELEFGELLAADAEGGAGVAVDFEVHAGAFEGVEVETSRCRDC